MKWIPLTVFDSPPVEFSHNFGHRAVLTIHFIYMANDFSFSFINGEITINGSIAENFMATNAFALHGSTLHTVAGLTTKLGRICFVAADNNPLNDGAMCAIGDFFSSRKKLHAVFLQKFFISSMIVKVTRKAIKSPNKNNIK
ncbi:MAG: hypothetical protein SPJ32_02200 [Oscillospiraceae bacterium]|nr:hypothetical protein [Oscillospiraceae bacterium]